MKDIRINKKSMLVLAGLILISSVFIFKNFLFGNQILTYTDIGSDTASQYLMHYQTIINHLREGSFSLWDFNNGVGINMYSLNLFDPFLMLLYLLGVLLGNDKIYGLLVYMQIFRTLLAGLAGYGFLSCFRLSERSKIVSAYLYAFNGFMVVWGQHYQFGTIVILFPLLLMAVEKALKRKEWHLGVTIVCAAVSLCSMYFGYMQLLTLGFYVLFRIAWEDRILSKAGLKRILCIYGSMILGIGIGMFQLLPSALTVFGVSGRMEGESLLSRIIKSLLPYKEPYYETLLKRFFSSNIEGVIDYGGYQNFYEAPNVFLSVLLVIAIVQFLYFFVKGNGGFKRKQKYLILLAVAAGAFLLTVPLGSLVYNGFAYPFSRHTFVCMPFFVLMIAWVMDKMLIEKQANRMFLIVTGVASTALYLWVYLSEHRLIAFLLAGLTVGIVLMLLGILTVKGKKYSEICFAGFVLSLMGTMVLDSFFSYTNYRGTLEKAPSEYMNEMYSESLQEALEYLRTTDDSFYRVEKDYNVGITSDCLNALAQNYMGISTYNSTLNKNTAEFFKKIWPNTMLINDDHYTYTNAVTDDFQASLLNVKYVISKNENLSVAGYELLKQFDDIYIYRNTGTEELGKFYTASITEEAFDKYQSSINQENILADYVICDTLPQLETSSPDIEKYKKIDIADQAVQSVDLVNGEVEIQLNPQIYSGENEKIFFEFEFAEYSDGRVCVSYGEYHTYPFSENADFPVILSLPKGCTTIKISDEVLKTEAVFKIENIKVHKAEVQDLSKRSEGVKIEQPEKDSIVKGTVDTAGNGVLMMAIPYENGWHAYVDGEEQPLHKVNYGFCGIYLEEGAHTIEMKYECPGFILGVSSSIFFLLLTVAIWCVIVRKEKKAKMRILLVN